MRHYSLFLLLIILSSCIATDYSYLSQVQSSQAEEVEDVRRTRSKRNPSRSNVCEDSSRCENICDRMFEYSSERRACYKKSLNDIGIIEDTFDVLKHSHYIQNDLSSLASRDFDLFAEIGLKSLNRVVIGDYRASERDEDDDDGGDDSHDDHGVEFNGYELGDARAVLAWIFNHHSSVGTSIADFSSSTELLYNLFKEASSYSRANPDDRLILGDEGLSEDDEKVLNGLASRNTRDFLTSADKDSPFLGHMHKVISDLCQSADIDNFSSSKSFKICLSYTYFYLTNVSCSSISRDQGVGYFMLKEGYREQPQSGSCSNDPNALDTLKSFDNWGDYWD